MRPGRCLRSPPSAGRGRPARPGRWAMFRARAGVPASRSWGGLLMSRDVGGDALSGGSMALRRRQGRSARRRGSCHLRAARGDASRVWSPAAPPGTGRPRWRRRGRRRWSGIGSSVLPKLWRVQWGGTRASMPSADCGAPGEACGPASGGAGELHVLPTARLRALGMRPDAGDRGKALGRREAGTARTSSSLLPGFGVFVIADRIGERHQSGGGRQQDGGQAASPATSATSRCTRQRVAAARVERLRAAP